MGARQVLEREVSSGCGRLSGTHLTGTIPVSEAVANDALQWLPDVPRGVRVEFHDANRIVVHYGVLHITLRLAETVDLAGPPRVHLRIASTVVAWTLRQVINVPHVRIDGTHVTVDLGAILALRAYAALWPHVRRVHLVTAPQVLAMEFDVRIA